MGWWSIVQTGWKDGVVSVEAANLVQSGIQHLLQWDGAEMEAELFPRKEMGMWAVRRRKPSPSSEESPSSNPGEW